LPAGTTIHYRAVAVSDFGKFAGADQAFTTAGGQGGKPPPPPPGPQNGTASVGRGSVSGTTARVRVTCKGPAGAKCKLLFRLTVTEILRGKKLVGVTARAKLKKRTVVVGSASVTLKAGETRTVRITLNRTGKALLAKRHKLPVRLRVTQTLLNGRASVVLTQTLTFKAPKKKKRHHK
jgi:hypothetical protein